MKTYCEIDPNILTKTSIGFIDTSSGLGVPGSEFLNLIFPLLSFCEPFSKTPFHLPPTPYATSGPSCTARGWRQSIGVG